MPRPGIVSGPDSHPRADPERTAAAPI